MKSSHVQKLIIKYKKHKSNMIFKQIMTEYYDIIGNLSKKYVHSPDARQLFYQIAHTQILYAIDKYDIKSNAKFVTYCYYYLQATARLFINDIKSKEILNVDSIIYNDVYDDFLLDIDKIFTPEEKLAFNGYIKKEITSSVMINRLRTKIERYLCLK